MMMLIVVKPLHSLLSDHVLNVAFCTSYITQNLSFSLL